jgi:hypothetical protein
LGDILQEVMTATAFLPLPKLTIADYAQSELSETIPIVPLMSDLVAGFLA